MEDIILGPGEEKRTGALFGDLEEIYNVTKYLKRDNVTIAETLALLNGSIEKLPVTKNQLSANEQIVHNMNFESAIERFKNVVVE